MAGSGVRGNDHCRFYRTYETHQSNLQRKANMDGSDMYPSPDGVDETTASKGSEESTDQGDTAEGETALIPKSLLAGKEWKPGDEIVFQIVHLYDDEAEIKYAPEKPKDEETMSGAQDKLSAMATEGY